MNSGQYPVQMTRKPMQERGLKGVKNPKTPLGEPATGPSRSLRLRRSFRKSVSIYPRSAPEYVLVSFHLISLAIRPLQPTPSGRLFSKIEDKTTPKGRVHFHHDTRPFKTRLVTLPHRHLSSTIFDLNPLVKSTQGEPGFESKIVDDKFSTESCSGACFSFFFFFS